MPFPSQASRCSALALVQHLARCCSRTAESDGYLAAAHLMVLVYVSYTSQSRREFVSIAGLRIDGRRPGEVRRIQCKLGLLSKVDGSALYEQGNTKVVAVVRGPRQVQSRSKAQHDRAVINCDYRCVKWRAAHRVV